MATGNKLHIGEPEDLKLILYLDQKSLSYTIYNSTINCFQNMKHYIIENKNHETIKRLIESDSYLNKRYEKTLCVIDVDSSTFIPEPLFDVTNIDNYLKLTSNKDDSFQAKYIKQQFIDSYAVFEVKRDLIELIESKYQPINLKSTASLLVDYALSLKQLNTNHILAQVNENNFHLTFIQNGEFIFYNKFHFDTKEDFLYYFMNCIHTLSIPSRKSSILIMSNLNKENFLFEEIKKYIPISFIKRPENFLYDNSIIESDSHKFHNLFSQLICE